MRVALLFVVAYLIGSIPFGYLIVRFKERADVRETGSGGTGATNVSRKAGKLAGVLTLFLDFIKGAIAVSIVPFLILGYDGSARWDVASAAVFVILGHCFPVWLGFRGGKGVATFLGVVLLFAPFAVVCFVIVFALIVILTRYVSLGSIIGCALMPLFVWRFPFRIYVDCCNVGCVCSEAARVTVTIVCSLIIIFMHRENIKRLLRGEENKFR